MVDWTSTLILKHRLPAAKDEPGLTKSNNFRDSITGGGVLDQRGGRQIQVSGIDL